MHNTRRSLTQLRHRQRLRVVRLGGAQTQTAADRTAAASACHIAQLRLLLPHVIASTHCRSPQQDLLKPMNWRLEQQAQY